MDVYILTQQEGTTTVPGAGTTPCNRADAWFQLNGRDDFYEITLGEISHLGLENGLLLCKAVLDRLTD